MDDIAETALRVMDQVLRLQNDNTNLRRSNAHLEKRLTKEEGLRKLAEAESDQLRQNLDNLNAKLQGATYVFPSNKS
jgi:tRNA(Ile2) C34 agmatinyltransferase TiaS